MINLTCIYIFVLGSSERLLGSQGKGRVVDPEDTQSDANHFKKGDCLDILKNLFSKFIANVQKTHVHIHEYLKAISVPISRAF